MVYWLGWIVYGASLVLAVGYAALFILVSIVAVGADPFATWLPSQHFSSRHSS